MVQDIYYIPRTFGNKPDELCLLEKCCGTVIVHMVGSLVTYEKYYSIGADVFVKTLVRVWGRYYRRYEKVLL